MRTWIFLFLCFLIGCVSTTPEKRNPSPQADKPPTLDDLLKTGEGLDRTQVAALEKNLLADPQNLSIRTKLIGYYYAHKINSDTARQSYEKHLKWLIRNHPEAEVASSPVSYVAITDSAFYREAKELWLAQMEKHPDNIAVITNAAEFFSYADMEMQVNVRTGRVRINKRLDDKEAIVPELEIAESLLKKACDLDSDNWRWHDRLARVYKKLKNLAPRESKPAYAAKALDALEHKLQHIPKRTIKFQSHALAHEAFDAQEWQKAEMYARKLLDHASQSKQEISNKLGVYAAKNLLGRLALRSGDLEAAKAYLLAAGEGLGTKFDNLPPDIDLAKALLAKGEKATVTAYLQLCKNFWKSGTDRLNSWIATIESGATPDFDVKIKNAPKIRSSFLVSGATPGSEMNTNTQNTHTAIFTTGLDDRDRPVDNLEEIPIMKRRVYIYAYWNGLSDGEHAYQCKIHDGDGGNVFENNMHFTSRRGHWSTWTWYEFDLQQDAPGDWRFEIFLDGKLEIEKTLIVLDRFGRRYDPARIDSLLQKSRVLAQSLAKYQSLTGYRDSTVVEKRSVQSWMDNRTFTRIHFAFQAPNRALIESRNRPRQETIFVSDGDSTFNYFGLWNQYRKEIAPKRLAGFSTGMAFSERTFLGSVLYSDNSVREVLRHMDEVAEIGHEKINGQMVTVVALTHPFEPSEFGMQLPQNSPQKPIKVHLWIGDEDFLIRKVALEYEWHTPEGNLPEEQRAMMEGMKIYVTETHTAIEVNPDFPADFFTFVPPDSAKLVERFAPPDRNRMDRMQKSELIGKPAPDFSLKDIDGNTVELADFKGKVIILDFWATWCGPCVKQMPAYITLQKNYASRGATVIGISTDEKAEMVREFAKQHKLNFPLLMANEKVKHEYGGITAIPTTFVIDKTGTIRYRYVGTPKDELAFQKHLEELLAE